jgi:CRP/FNR family nitrogen fixation transcriptional regulator
MADRLTTDFQFHLAPRELASTIPEPLGQPERLAEARTYYRGGVICRQGDAARYIFQLVAGVAIRHVIRADGRRQIIDLLLPGDCFGFTIGKVYRSTTECICDTTAVTRYRRERIDATGAHGCHQAEIEALARLEDHIQVIGRTTSCEKVGAFLLELERRMSNQPQDLALPISRYDIADHLMISVETVSRALGNLKQQGSIRLTGPRAVKILDHDALEVGRS